MHVPMADLRAQYQGLKAEIDRAVLVAESAQFILGDLVAAGDSSPATDKHAVGRPVRMRSFRRDGDWPRRR